MSLIAAGGQAIGALPSIIPSEFEREQKKELEALKRRQEQDALGLTAEERRVIENQVGMKTQSQFDQAQAQRNRLLQGGMGVGGADKLLADASLAEAQGKVASQAAQQVEMANLQERAKEEQLIRDLEAAQGEYARARSDALVSPVTAGVGAYVGQMGAERLLQQGAKEGLDAASIAAEQMAIKNIGSEFGLSESQAKMQLDYLKKTNTDLYNFYTNPETAAYLSMLGGDKTYTYTR